MLIRYEDCKDRLEIRLCDPELKPERIKDLPVIYVGDWAGYFAVNIGSCLLYTSFLTSVKSMDLHLRPRQSLRSSV